MPDQTSKNSERADVTLFCDDNEAVLERMKELGFSQRDANLVGYQLYTHHKMAFYKTGRFDYDLLALTIMKLGPTREYAADLVERLKDAGLITENQSHEESWPPCLSEFG